MSSLPIALRRNAYWNGRQNKKSTDTSFRGIGTFFYFVLYTPFVSATHHYAAPACRRNLRHAAVKNRLFRRPIHRALSATTQCFFLCFRQLLNFPFPTHRFPFRCKCGLPN